MAQPKYQLNTFKVSPLPSPLSLAAVCFLFFIFFILFYHFVNFLINEYQQGWKWGPDASSDISYYLNSHHVDFLCWVIGNRARPMYVTSLLPSFFLIPRFLYSATNNKYQQQNLFHRLHRSGEGGAVRTGHTRHDHPHCSMGEYWIKEYGYSSTSFSSKPFPFLPRSLNIYFVFVTENNIVQVPPSIQHHGSHQRATCTLNKDAITWATLVFLPSLTRHSFPYPHTHPHSCFSRSSPLPLTLPSRSL